MCAYYVLRIYRSCKLVFSSEMWNKTQCRIKKMTRTERIKITNRRVIKNPRKFDLKIPNLI